MEWRDAIRHVKIDILSSGWEAAQVRKQALRPVVGFAGLAATSGLTRNQTNLRAAYVGPKT